MWTNENRARYERRKLRYPSDLTDAEWGFVAPLIPPAKRGGGKRKVNIREVVNGLLYVLSTGCQWRAIPKDFPPKSTVYGYFDLWIYDGTLERIHHVLYVLCREAEGRMAMMQARRSRARSGIFSSTRLVCCFMQSFIPLTFKIATAESSSWARCLVNFRFLGNYSPMADTKVKNFARRRRKLCQGSQQKSSSDLTWRMASRFCRGVGLSREHWRGLDAVGD